MKAIYLVLCLMVVLAGTAMANSGYDDGYDDYYYGDGYYGCCCAPVFALVAVGAFAIHKRH